MKRVFLVIAALGSVAAAPAHAAQINLSDDLLLWDGGDWQMMTQAEDLATSQPFVVDYTATWGETDIADVYPNHAFAGDKNGDGRGDLGFTRDLGGGFIHWLWNLNNGAPAWPSAVNDVEPVYFGVISADRATVADFNHDGRDEEVAVRDNDTLNTGSLLSWYINLPDGTVGPIFFGLDSDLPCPGDFNGDGWDDLAIFRPSTGQWVVAVNRAVEPLDFNFIFYINGLIFGGPDDTSVAAGDLDADGFDDMILLRPSTNQILVNLHSADNPEAGGYGNELYYGTVDMEFTTFDVSISPASEIHAANIMDPVSAAQHWVLY